MRTVAFVTQKGGSGKSTLASSLAVAAHEQGERVFVIDMDPQSSLLSWAKTRGLDDVPVVMAAGVGRNVHVPDRHTPVPWTSAVGVASSVEFSTRQNFVDGQDTP